MTLTLGYVVLAACFLLQFALVAVPWVGQPNGFWAYLGWVYLGTVGAVFLLFVALLLFRSGSGGYDMLWFAVPLSIALGLAALGTMSCVVAAIARSKD